MTPLPSYRVAGLRGLAKQNNLPHRLYHCRSHSHGNELTTTDPLGNVTHHTYGINSQVLATTVPLGNTISSSYDSVGNLLAIAGQASGPSYFSYDQHLALL